MKATYESNITEDVEDTEKMIVENLILAVLNSNYLNLSSFKQFSDNHAKLNNINLLEIANASFPNLAENAITG